MITYCFVIASACCAAQSNSQIHSSRTKSHPSEKCEHDLLVRLDSNKLSDTYSRITNGSVPAKVFPRVRHKWNWRLDETLLKTENISIFVPIT